MTVHRRDRLGAGSAVANAGPASAAAGSQTANAAGVVAARRSVAVNDGTQLSYLEAGEGKTLVLIPGWSQTAEQFKFQIEGLADRYRVIALDMRGHGDSAKPAYGYTIQRLAKDLEDVLVALDLRNATILGHSMGCSVLWCHFDLFGAARIAALRLLRPGVVLDYKPGMDPGAGRQLRLDLHAGDRHRVFQ